MKTEYRIIAAVVHRKDDVECYISFPEAAIVGMHTKHLVGDKADERGFGISFRRNDTKEEFYFLKSGTWRSLEFLWNKPLPSPMEV